MVSGEEIDTTIVKSGTLRPDLGSQRMTAQPVKNDQFDPDKPVIGPGSAQPKKGDEKTNGSDKAP